MKTLLQFYPENKWKEEKGTENSTSRRKSPCLLSSASMALSRIPPDVTLAIYNKRKLNKLKSIVRTT